MSTNDELRELLAKATPGPWRWNAPTGSVVSNQSHPVAYVSEAAHRLRFDGTTGEDGPLIVAAVNALPDLLARLDSLAGEVDATNAGWQRTYDHDCALLIARAEAAERERDAWRTRAEAYRHQCEAAEVRAEKWEPAQRAIRALRAGGEAVAWIAPGGSLHHSSHVEAFGFANVGWRPLYAAPPAGQPERAELDRAATLDAGVIPQEWIESGGMFARLCDSPYGLGISYNSEAACKAFDAFFRATPPAPAGDAVAGLVKEWLDKAADELAEGRLNDAQGYSHIGREHHLAAKWLDWCARKLAAALQSSGREGMYRGMRNRLIGEVMNRFANQPYEVARAEAEALVNEYEDALAAAKEPNRD